MIVDNVNNIDIQLFAEEKTEKATPKRRKEARDKGQVIRSSEINSAVTILSLFFTLSYFSSSIIDKLKDIYLYFYRLELPLDEVFTYKGLNKITIDVLQKSGIVLLPIFACALAAGLAVNYAQVGFLFTSKPISPDLNRINPIQGFKRIFSKRVFYEFIKSLIKMAVIISVVYSIYIQAMSRMTDLLNNDIANSFAYIGGKAYDMGMKSGVALLIMSIFDYLYQWWDHEKNLRMSKQEIKDEYKLTEGDPQIKSRIKEKQRQMAMSRMMQDVPKADVIIVNPVHYAVALKYNPEENDAPIVIAKGQDYLALKIKEVAKQNDVVIVENKPLAQSLYNTTEIGQTISPELFHAVAEVLAFVYSLKRDNR